MVVQTPGDTSKVLIDLLALQRTVQTASSEAQAGFIIVNRTAAVAPCDQATLLRGPQPSRLKVTRISHVSEVDRTAPQVAWMERLAAYWSQRTDRDAPWNCARSDLPADLREEAADLVPPQLLVLPLASARSGCLGLLVLGRQQAWTPAEVTLLDYLATSYGTALEALQARASWSLPRGLAGRSTWIAAGVLFVAGWIPVRLSVLAPAEVQARAPFIVTAPLDGVISRVTVNPNQSVRKGDVLAHMEATDLRGAQEVSRKALEVAQAELRRSQQAAFQDGRGGGDLAQLRAQVDLRRQELEYASTRHRNTELVSARDGVAIVGDPDQWKGRPVKVGERILQIADPAQVEITLMVPVRDAIALEPGREVRVFLDAAPLDARRARIHHGTYEPVTIGQEAPAYKVTAYLEDGDAPPRIGLRGTARIYGERVSLAYFLFRRPLTSLRQWLGL